VTRALQLRPCVASWFAEHAESSEFNSDAKNGKSHLSHFNSLR
jgi:hypothetical protein